MNSNPVIEIPSWVRVPEWNLVPKEPPQPTAYEKFEQLRLNIAACEPTLRGDLIAEQLRNYYEKHRPRGLWNFLFPDYPGCRADNLMLGMSSLVQRLSAPVEPMTPLAPVTTLLAQWNLELDTPDTSEERKLVLTQFIAELTAAITPKPW